MVSKVIPARVWRHVYGRTASIRGAAPWHNHKDRCDWTTEVIGWTVQHSDGTTGLGRPPFATREEAQAWCDAHPSFRGMSQD